MSSISSLDRLDAACLDTPTFLRKRASSGSSTAELKGIAASIPNQGILSHAPGLQEAKNSSEIENIVSAHDERFKGDVLPEPVCAPAAKQVLRYRQALRVGQPLHQPRAHCEHAGF